MLAAARLRSAGLAGDVVVDRRGRRGVREHRRAVGPASARRRRRRDRHRADRAARLRRAQGLRLGGVETRGRAAHGSRPAEGIDAITRMAPVLTRLAELESALDAAPAHRCRARVGARVADRGRPGAVELPRALRPLARAPHLPGRDRRGRAPRVRGAGRGDRGRRGAPRPRATTRSRWIRTRTCVPARRAARRRP